MNSRSGLLTFLFFVLLAAMITLQVLGMIQSDRLYQRLNSIIDAVAGRKQAPNTATPTPQTTGDSANKGDWLVWGLAGEVRSLNLIISTDLATNYIVLGNIIETLFEQDLDADNIKLKPKLAEKMDISDNGLEIIITLKDNIHFSDNVPITADDVLFTYQTIMNPGVDCAALRNYMENITEVVRIDNKTVKFILKEQYWKTIETIGGFYVFPKHIYQFTDPKKFNKYISNPVGSGPYVFEKWDVGGQVVLKRNENYWDQRPAIDKVVFKFISNANATLAALQSHDIDIFEPGSEQVTDMPKNPQFAKEFNTIIFWDPTFGFWYLGWNEEKPFFKDVKVRLAMTYLTDRETLAKQLTKGNGAVVSSSFYIYGKQNNPDIKPWPYDPKKAVELLDEAGWKDTDGDGVRDKNGIPFRFKYSYPAGSTTSEQSAKSLKDDAAKIGVDVIIDPVEWSIFLGNLQDHKFDAAESMWAGVIEQDPYQILHSSQIKGGSNYVSFNNPRADKIIEQARRELNGEKRYALYHKFHKIVHEEQPYTFLMTRPRYYFIDRRFENVMVHKLGLNPLEWYVPKEKQRYK